MRIIVPKEKGHRQALAPIRLRLSCFPRAAARRTCTPAAAAAFASELEYYTIIMMRPLPMASEFQNIGMLHL